MILSVQSKNEVFDISSYVSSITLSDDIEEVSATLEFEFAFSREKYYKHYNINVGDKITFTDNGIVVFYGIIITKDVNEKSYTYSCNDLGFYLKNNEVVQQFKSARADDAISTLCDFCGIKVKKIASMDKLITYIYNESVSDIIKDILEQVQNENGKKYYIEFQNDTLVIDEYFTTPVTTLYKPASNVAAFDLTKYPNSVSKSYSIENLKNSVIASVKANDSEDSDNDNVEVVYSKKDDKSIEKYGILQAIVDVNEEDLSKANEIANNKLIELNKIEQSISISLLGNINLRAARIIKLNIPNFDINGNYRIISSNHQYSCNGYTVDLEVEAY